MEGGKGHSGRCLEGLGGALPGSLSRDYVKIQREKEFGVSAIHDAFAPTFTTSSTRPHGGVPLICTWTLICMIEQMAITMQGRFCRFCADAPWRNLGVFGMMDETRHAQLDLRFSHDLIKNEAALRLVPEGVPYQRMGRDRRSAIFSTTSCSMPTASRLSLATSFTVEHGFTNIQFVALASDAMDAGDINFSNLLSSIQTDEARHAQLGFPTLEGDDEA